MAEQTFTLKNDDATIVGTLLVDQVGANIIPTSKITIGADDSDDGFVNSANPLPCVVTNAGTFVSQIDGSALTALQLIDDIVSVVDAAGGAAPTGVLSLATRDDALSALTPVEGDFVGLRTDANGALWVIPSGTVTVDGSGVTQPISAVSLPLPTGAATDSTLSSIKSSTSIIDDPVFVDDAAFTLTSSSVMMAGAIRDDSLGALSAVEGDAVPLRVGSTGALHVTGGGGGTEYTEDAATANPIVGTATLMERDDVLSTVTPIAGDWIGFRGTAEGALWVQDFNSDAIRTAVEGTLTVGSHAVTNAGTFATQATLQAGTAEIGKLAAGVAEIGNVKNSGTFIVQEDGGALTALELVDDIIAVLGTATYSEATTKGAVVGAVRNDTLAALAGTDNEIAPLQVNASGALYVTVDGALPAGTNAIGKLAANSGVDIGDVDVLSAPVRDRTTDNQGVALQTDAIMDDVTVLTPKFSAINATTNGDNTIVAAVSGKKVRVLSYSLVADAAVGCAFDDGSGGTELSGQMAFAANGGISVPFSPVGHFETTANTVLNLETDAVANVRGHVCYVEV